MTQEHRQDKDADAFMKSAKRKKNNENNEEVADHLQAVALRNPGRPKKAYVMDAQKQSILKIFVETW